MKTPSILGPQPIQGRSHVPIIVSTILALHFVLLGALLIAGCKPTATRQAYAEPTNNAYDALPAWVEPTNPSPFEATGSVPPDRAAEYAVPVIPPPAFVPPAPAPTRSAAPAPAPARPAAGLPAVIPASPTGTPVPPVAAGNVHVVVSGDNFYTLAKRYGVSRQAIERANPRIKPTQLQIGDKLTIPAPEPPGPKATVASSSAPAKVYVVRSGDNLSKIARAHDTTVAKLRAENNLKTDSIKVGQELKLP